MTDTHRTSRSSPRLMVSCGSDPCCSLLLQIQTLQHRPVVESVAIYLLAVQPKLIARRGQGHVVTLRMGPPTLKSPLINMIPAEDYNAYPWDKSSLRVYQLLQSTSSDSWIIHFLFTAGDRCVTSVMKAHGVFEKWWQGGGGGGSVE